MLDLARKRILLTGGAGFLGSWLVRRLEADGCRAITVPRSQDVDLRREAAGERLYEAARPEIVIHLAARVGRIGANQANPGSFLYDNYDNVVMGALILTGFEGGIVWDGSKPDGQARRSVDTTRAEREFGFRVRTGFADGLGRTVDWYLSQRAARH